MISFCETCAGNKDYAKLARAASRGAEDANPLEVTEVQAEEWVARAVGSGKQLMLQKRDKDASRVGGGVARCVSEYPCSHTDIDFK